MEGGGKGMCGCVDGEVGVWEGGGVGDGWAVKMDEWIFGLAGGGWPARLAGESNTCPGIVPEKRARKMYPKNKPEKSAPKMCPKNVPEKCARIMTPNMQPEMVPEKQQK